MKIAVVGSGYVGLVAGACFADSGTNVMCIDVNEAKLAKLRAGEVPFFEPRLADLLKRNWPHRLDFTSSLPDGIRGREVVFVAVGTPPQEDGSADLSYVLGVAEEVSKAAEHDLVLVLKSTVPVGTNEKVRAVVDKHAKHKISVVSNPEFLKEGDAVNDFFKPDRIVIGTDDERARKALTDVYRPLSLNQGPLMFTSRRTAELIKYAANAFLATKITFINEIADLAEKVGADVQEVARGIGADNRIGSKFLHAGPGFGGSCFPKDTRALVKTAQDYDVPLRVVEAVMSVNENRKRAMARKVAKAVGGELRGKTIAVLGLTFKPDTDDMREAPSIPLITALKDLGARVRAYDPAGMQQARTELPDIEYAADAYACARGADAVVIVTEWTQFRALDLDRLKREMAAPVIVDLRNIYRPAGMAEHGFVYESVGRPGKHG